MNILITGGAGFIGSHFIEQILQSTDWNITVLDRLSDDGVSRMKNIGVYNHPRVRFHNVELSRPISARVIGHADYILHLGSLTNINKSILSPTEFILTNIVGTFHTLELAVQLPGTLRKFVYFSTDEVFGPVEDGKDFKEWSRHNSTTPYAATKAAAEQLCLAWASVYDVPVIITYSMNLMGERQPREKFLPSVVRAALNVSRVRLYVDPQTQIPAIKNFLHARDAVSAVLFLLEHGELREKYNIATSRKISSLDVLLEVGKIMHTPIAYDFVQADGVRRGFFLRYGLDSEKLDALGWKPPKTFEENVAETVAWMMKNRSWIK